MSRSRRRGRRVSNHNKPQVAVEANQASSKSPSIYCGVCGKGHIMALTWELPYSGKYNVIVTIPACGYCRDPKHFKDFLGMGGKWVTITQQIIFAPWRFMWSQPNKAPALSLKIQLSLP